MGQFSAGTCELNGRQPRRVWTVGARGDDKLLPFPPPHLRAIAGGATRRRETTPMLDRPIGYGMEDCHFGGTVMLRLRMDLDGIALENGMIRA